MKNNCKELEDHEIAKQLWGGSNCCHWWWTIVPPLKMRGARQFLVVIDEGARPVWEPCDWTRPSIHHFQGLRSMIWHNCSSDWPQENLQLKFGPDPIVKFWVLIGSSRLVKNYLRYGSRESFCLMHPIISMNLDLDCWLRWPQGWQKSFRWCLEWQEHRLAFTASWMWLWGLFYQILTIWWCFYDSDILLDCFLWVEGVLFEKNICIIMENNTKI